LFLTVTELKNKLQEFENEGFGNNKIIDCENEDYAISEIRLDCEYGVVFDIRMIKGSDE